MSVISSNKPRALFIYTNVDDQTFHEAHFKEHGDLLGRAYDVDAIRTGTLSSDRVSILTKGKCYDLIEIAAHGNVDVIDLGDEKLSQETSRELEKLAGLLNEYGVFLLQTCRSGAEVNGVVNIARQLAYLSHKTIRVIANKGTQFEYEFRQLYPMDVRLINNGLDLTAWIQRCPDGRVVHVDTGVVDRFQKKLTDPIDLQLAYRFAAGFRVQELFERFKQLASTFTCEDFRETRWGPLLNAVEESKQSYLLNIAGLDRYGAILQDLTLQNKEEAMLALFGSCPDLSINMETFPEYLLCCMEIDGKVPLTFNHNNLGRILKTYQVRYSHVLLTLLEKTTIDRSFVIGTEWNDILDRLEAYQTEFQSSHDQVLEITPEMKKGSIKSTENELSFGVKPVTPYERIWRNILTLAAVEKYQGMLIHLDNRQGALENPAAIAYSKLTGGIVHPKEFSFSRFLRGDQSIFDMVKIAFKQLEEGTIEEYDFFSGPLNSVCLNQLYSEMFSFLQQLQMRSVAKSPLAFLNETAKKFQNNILRKLQLYTVPIHFDNSGYVEYHKEATVEKFIVMVREGLQHLPFVFEDDEIIHVAVEVGFMYESEVQGFLKVKELQHYLHSSRNYKYSVVSRAIFLHGNVNVNRPVKLIKGSPFPLHIAAKNKDQKLITLLLDLGAYVDAPDIKGMPARQYARGCNFKSSEGFQIRSLIEQQETEATYREIQRYRLAVGGYREYLQLNGRNKMIVEHAWDAIRNVETTPSYLLAADMIKSRFNVEYLTMNLSNAAIDRVFDYTRKCVHGFSEIVKRYHSKYGRIPSFALCFKVRPRLIYLCWKLEEELGKNHLFPEERSLMLIYASRNKSLVHRVIDRLSKEENLPSILLLYPYLKSHQGYMGLVEKYFKVGRSNDLTELIRESFGRLERLRQLDSKHFRKISRELRSNFPEIKKVT